MRIELTHVLVGVGVGGLDEVLERQDADNGRTETIKKWSTWSRAGLVALGFLGQAMDIMPREAAAVAQSELPLLTKTALAEVWKKKVVASGANRFLGTPAPVGTPASRIGRSYQPEFKNTAAW